ncbi:MAG TPA: hypothetical protein VJ228_04180, partial [Candidatus Acidoferrales bacterium]|nr:hypothetical protein [Candidatus Acidoferrales bacterium]
MSEDSEKNGARSAIILLILVFLVAGFGVKFGLQTLSWIEAKLWASEDPWLATVPQPLPPPSAAPKGPQLKASDYEFNSPWPGNPKPVGLLTATQFRYDTGQVIVFFDPESQIDTVRAMKTSNPTEYQKFATVFADKPINSNYELYQDVYSAAPAQLSPLMDTRDALRSNALLLWKLSFGFDLPADGQFYSFDWGKIRGFQFGDPSKQRPIALRAFDERDHQYRFILT